MNILVDISCIKWEWTLEKTKNTERDIRNRNSDDASKIFIFISFSSTEQPENLKSPSHVQNRKFWFNFLGLQKIYSSRDPFLLLGENLLPFCTKGTIFSCFFAVSKKSEMHTWQAHFSAFDKNGTYVMKNAGGHWCCFHPYQRKHHTEGRKKAWNSLCAIRLLMCYG